MRTYPRLLGGRRPILQVGGLSIERSRAEDVHHITLRGEFDLAGADQVREVFDETGGSEAVVVDTANLDFIDSSGLAVLVETRKKLGQDRFELIPGPAVLRLLELTRTDGFFGI